MNEDANAQTIVIRLSPMTINMMIIEVQTWMPGTVYPGSATKKVIDTIRGYQARARVFNADPQRKEFAATVEAELAQRDRELLASLRQSDEQPQPRAWLDRVKGFFGFRVIG